MGHRHQPEAEPDPQARQQRRPRHAADPAARGAGRAAASCTTWWCWAAFRYSANPQAVPTRRGSSTRRSPAKAAPLSRSEVAKLAEKFKRPGRGPREGARGAGRAGRRRRTPRSPSCARQIEAAQAANDARPTTTTTPRPRPATCSSTSCSREAGWPLAEPGTASIEVTGMPNDERHRLRRLRAVGRRRAAARPSSRPSGPTEEPAGRAAAGEALRRLPGRSSSAAGRSSSTPTATSTGSGTTPPATRRGEVQGFFTRDELELMIQRRHDPPAARRRCRSTAAIVERHYQHRAIRPHRRRRSTGKQREALLVMATGSGKTRTVIALVDQLMQGQLGQAGAVPRRPHGPGEPGRQRVQGPPAATRPRSTW